MIAPRDRKPARTAKPEPDTTRADGLVAVDVGNSRIALATWQDERLSEPRHLPCEPIEPVIRHAQALWDALPADRGRAIVALSVNPPALGRLEAALRAAGLPAPLVVGRQLPPPIAVDVDHPENVGADRLCVAAAAFARVRKACVVADFGTALTIDLVADNNVFLGGTILPGMQLAARALHEHTALLPLVEVGASKETLGKDTSSAIRNGIFAMMVGGLREITERYATQIGKWPPLVLTGGDAQAIASACEFVDHVWPDLSLEGVVRAYRNMFGDDDPHNANQ